MQRQTHSHTMCGSWYIHHCNHIKAPKFHDVVCCKKAFDATFVKYISEADIQLSGVAEFDHGQHSEAAATEECGTRRTKVTI